MGSGPFWTGWILLWTSASSVESPCAYLRSALRRALSDPAADSEIADVFAALAPGLHIGQREALNVSIDAKFRTDLFRFTARTNMSKYGYFELNGFFSGSLHVLQLVSQAIENLDKCGLHQNFVLLYDEVWELAHAANDTLATMYGLRSNMDFFVFNVKPGRKSWPGHRDRLGRVDFQRDGMPKYTTVWMAVTDASPENTSCVYAVPAHKDSRYMTPKAEPAVNEKLGAQPLPVQAGTVIVWSDRLYHWGSTSPSNSTFSRRSVTFAMSMPDYEIPYLDLAGKELPTVEARLALIAYQLAAHSHIEPLTFGLRSNVIRWLFRYKAFLHDGWYESIEDKLLLRKDRQFEL